MPKALPQEIKEKARRMVMNGTTRKDVALMLGITHSSVYIWTRDIKLPRIKTTPKQDSIMKILLERGYFIPEKHSEVDTLRLLKERHGIKIASVKASHVAFVKGRETDALKAFLRRKRIHYISSHKLAQLERAFGIKNTEAVRENLKENNVKLTDFIK